MNNSSQNNKKRVAIIGLGFRLPGSSNCPTSFWNNLVNKFDGIVAVDRWSDSFNISKQIKSGQAGLISLDDEIKQFDPLMFGISDAELIDPQQRLLLKCVWESFEDANIDPIKLRGSDTSVYIGIATNDYHNNLKNENETLTNIFSSTSHSASNRISFCYDFRGASLSIDTACSGSANAISLGYQSIIQGNSSYSIVGGSSLILEPLFSKAYSYLSMLGESGRCNSFDESADGFVRGEGAAVVILKSLDDAIRDANKIYCIIESVSSNSDGSFNDKNNFYSPSKNAQCANIQSMFNASSKVPSFSESTIDYCELHATGTPTGDPIECESISLALNNRPSDEPLLIGSLKSNIGHLEAASGVASLIKCCLMFKHRQFVPNINFNRPNPKINFKEWNLKVVTQVMPFPTNKNVSMIINNFGITASNVAIGLSEFNSNDYLQKDQQQDGATQITLYKNDDCKQYLIPFSANSRYSLDSSISALIDDYSNYSKTVQFFDLVQHQILSKSQQLYQRSVILASKWSDLLNDNNIIKTSNSITSNLKSSGSSVNGNGNGLNICFVFSGQGTQFENMAQELYFKDLVFKATIDLIDSKLEKYYGYSVFERLRNLNQYDSTITINNPIIAQPAITMVQIALYESLTKQFNIRPNFIIGHSLGELTSLYCSGSIDLDTLCYITYHRSKIQERTVGSGRMLSINISSSEFISKFSSLKPEYSEIEIACYNSQNSIVVGAQEYLLREIEATLKNQGIHCAFLSSPSSFHTKSQESTMQGFYSLQFESNKPTTPLLSTVYKDFFDNEKLSFNKEYCYKNAREPVYFDQTIQNLYQHIESNKLGEKLVFIEISPHSALQYHLKQLKPSISASSYFQDISILTTLNRNKSDYNQIFQLVSTLYCNYHYPINFENQLINGKTTTTNNIAESFKFKELGLPRYQWDDKVYWKINSKLENYYSNGPAIEILGNKNDASPFSTYNTIINLEKPSFEYLKGHSIKNKYYFPGCGYVENIIQHYSGSDLIIKYLEFKAPLIFNNNSNSSSGGGGGNGIELQTNIYQISKKEFRVQFHYYDSVKSKWISTSNGNIQLFEFINSNEKKLDLVQLKSKCNLTTLSSQDFYDYTKTKLGLSYGGHFKSVKECSIGNGCSLAVVKFDRINQDYLDTTLNCATLDCCLHSTLALVEYNSSIVFDKIEGFKFYSSNLKSNYRNDLYVYSVFKGIKANSFEFSITIMTQDGTIVIEIDNCVMTSTSPIKESLEIEYPLNEISSTYFKEYNYSQPSQLEQNQNNIIIYGSGDDSNSNIQHLIKNKLNNTKLILLSRNSYSKESSNYLASSVTGSFKYFIDQVPSLSLFLFDFDNISLLNQYNFNIISNLINSTSGSSGDDNSGSSNEREFIIRNNQFYIEKIKEEINIFSNNQFKSNSIESYNSSSSSYENIYLKLNENLEFQMQSKTNLKLKKDQVEVAVKAIGLNYKDYLVYTRMLPAELINHNSNIQDPEFGLEFSGIIVRSNSSEFKAGQEVFGLHYNSSSSHIIVDKNEIVLKPDNISHIEASSIPCVYLTSYYSIFKVGAFDINAMESILIHSASGGVGLSSLELLKWKQHKGNVFVTVGSEDKKKYLIEKYGSFISGIYSTRTKDYVEQIKLKLLELGSKKQGVDVILNTLPGEFIESNFRVLNVGGRIVDLSITHLNPNEFIDLNVFKYNYSYSNVELIFVDYVYLTKILKDISGAISSGSLSLIPITEYSVLDIRDSFDYINQRKHIGKICINYDNILNLLNNNNNNNDNSNQETIIMKSNYSIKELGKSILITGQSGVALALTKWITKYSSTVENIIIISKSKLKWELELLINSNKNRINYYFNSIDIQDSSKVENSIVQLFKENPNLENNIDSIFHLAFSHIVAEPLEINIQHLNESHGAKTIGAITLHDLSIKYKWNIKNFILASSIVSVFSLFNQCTYTSANNTIDSIIKYRKSIGLPALSLNWGNIGETGIVARNNDSIGELLDDLGFQKISINMILGSLDLFIQNQSKLENNYNNFIINKLDYNKLQPSLLYNHKLDFNKSFNNKDKSTNNNNNNNYSDDSILNKLKSKISELLSINQENINQSINLSEFGVESILVVQFKNFLDKEFKIKNLFTISELQNHSINSILKKLQNSL